MTHLTETQMGIEEWRKVAVAAIAEAVGEDDYEMCRSYFEDGTARTELAFRFRLGVRAVGLRIAATVTRLRRLSLKSGISLLPPDWEKKIEQNAMKATRAA